jgi:PAS domain S-box-containing protein
MHQRKVLRSRGAQACELLLKRKDGPSFYARLESIFSTTDGLTTTRTILTDITEHKRAEEELCRSRDELEMRVYERTEELRRQAELIEVAHDAIIVRDFKACVIRWNRGAERMYGCSKEEALHKSLGMLLQTEFSVPLEQIIARVRPTYSCRRPQESWTTRTNRSRH